MALLDCFMLYMGEKMVSEVSWVPAIKIFISWKTMLCTRPNLFSKALCPDTIILLGMNFYSSQFHEVQKFEQPSLFALPYHLAFISASAYALAPIYSVPRHLTLNSKF